jgi:hypothetical protein
MACLERRATHKGKEVGALQSILDALLGAQSISSFSNIYHNLFITLWLYQALDIKNLNQEHNA